jgi:hypothetical protein
MGHMVDFPSGRSYGTAGKRPPSLVHATTEIVDTLH